MDEDKAREITKMGHIYKNATLTIVAAKATGVECGFLEPRRPLEVCILPLVFLTATLGSISVVKPFNRWARPYLHRPKEALYSRAWALQEFLLSARLLIYGQQEMIWRCQSLLSPAVDNHITYFQPWPCKRLPSIVFNKENSITRPILQWTSWQGCGQALCTTSRQELCW